MKHLIFAHIAALFVLSSEVNAQSVWNTSAAYLGQKPPSDKPEIFAENLMISKDTFAFDRVAFSDDGREFYYPSNTTWFDNKNAKIRYFTFDDNKWNGPFVLNALYYAPTFSIDNNTLYFLGGKGDSIHSFVWQSHRNDTGWAAPVAYLKKGYGLYDFMPTRSGKCYVGSNAHQGNNRDFSTYDICSLSMKRKDTVIESLGIPINTPGFDGDFYIAKDETYIIVSAKETITYECELYISFRKPDHTWTNPKSLGPLINDGIAHRWGEYVTPDGKYLFYTKGTSPQDCHIYWVRFDNLLKQLQHTNFAPYVKMPIKDQVASAGHLFSQHISGDTFVDDDGNNTLKYSVALSDGNPLPDWLNFDIVTRRFSGISDKAGKYKITVTVTDSAQETAACTFLLQVNDKNE